jgi:hypothetical protein
MEDVIYKDEWVLINAYYYTFWMLRSEFEKYKIKNIKIIKIIKKY